MMPTILRLVIAATLSLTMPLVAWGYTCTDGDITTVVSLSSGSHSILRCNIHPGGQVLLYGGGTLVFDSSNVTSDGATPSIVVESTTEALLLTLQNTWLSSPTPNTTVWLPSVSVASTINIRGNTFDQAADIVFTSTALLPATTINLHANNVSNRRNGTDWDVVNYTFEFESVSMRGGLISVASNFFSLTTDAPPNAHQGTHNLLLRVSSTTLDALQFGSIIVANNNGFYPAAFVYVGEASVENASGEAIFEGNRVLQGDTIWDSSLVTLRMGITSIARRMLRVLVKNNVANHIVNEEGSLFCLLQMLQSTTTDELYLDIEIYNNTLTARDPSIFTPSGADYFITMFRPEMASFLGNVSVYENIFDLVVFGRPDVVPALVISFLDKLSAGTFSLHSNTVNMTGSTQLAMLFASANALTLENFVFNVDRNYITFDITSANILFYFATVSVHNKSALLITSNVFEIVNSTPNGGAAAWVSSGVTFTDVEESQIVNVSYNQVVGDCSSGYELFLPAAQLIDGGAVRGFGCNNIVCGSFLRSLANTSSGSSLLWETCPLTATQPQTVTSSPSISSAQSASHSGPVTHTGMVSASSSSTRISNSVHVYSLTGTSSTSSSNPIHAHSLTGTHSIATAPALSATLSLLPRREATKTETLRTLTPADQSAVNTIDSISIAIADATPGGLTAAGAVTGILGGLTGSLDSASTVQLAAILSMVECRAHSQDSSTSRMLVTPLQVGDGFPSAYLIGCIIIGAAVSLTYFAVCFVVFGAIRKSNPLSRDLDATQPESALREAREQRIFRAKLYLLFPRLPVLVLGLLLPGFALDSGSLLYGKLGTVASVGERVLGGFGLTGCVAFCVYHAAAGVYAVRKAQHQAGAVNDGEGTTGGGEVYAVPEASPSSASDVCGSIEEAGPQNGSHASADNYDGAPSDITSDPHSLVWFIPYSSVDRALLPNLVTKLLLPAGRWNSVASRGWCELVTNLKAAMSGGGCFAAHNVIRVTLVSILAAANPSSSSACDAIQGLIASVFFCHGALVGIFSFYRVPVVNPLQALQSVFLGLLACTTFIQNEAVKSAFAITLMTLAVLASALGIVAVLIEVLIQRLRQRQYG